MPQLDWRESWRNSRELPQQDQMPEYFIRSRASESGLQLLALQSQVADVAERPPETA
jgi:hypothetical protein